MNNNRLEAAEDLLAEIREVVENEAVVSLSYDGDEIRGFISFHENEDLAGSVEPIHIQFEKHDFSESGIKKLTRDLESFVPSHISEQLS